MEKVFIVSGFGTDDRSYYENQTFLVGMYMTQESFASVMKENKPCKQLPERKESDLWQ